MYNDIGWSVGQHPGRLLDFIIIYDFPTIGGQFIEKFLHCCFVERSCEPLVFNISFHNDILINKCNEKWCGLQGFQYLYENNPILKHCIMSKRDDHIKVLNSKVKIKKDKVKVWRDVGIDEQKIDKMEEEQLRLEEWLEDIEAMGDY
jgi:hypothetical protein